jgi:hypothetical protein
MTTARIELPRPQGKQVELVADERRYKLGRAGRRGGKTRTGLIVGVAGHGAKPNGRGMVQGGAILWVPPTIPQGRAIWFEEIVPRFRGVPGFQVRETERRVIGPNGGSLEILSAEAIDNARGRRYDGAILDECREYDLDYVWDNVVRPTLIDRQGWALFISSTKAGSAFNRFCEEQLEGKRNNRLWGQHHWRTRDNPVLKAEEIEEVYGEYVGREVVAQEELDALLLTGGAGLAFPEFVDDLSQKVHVVPRRLLPAGWRYIAGLDWGYVKGCYVVGAIGPEGHLEIVWECPLERMHARDAARKVLRECPFPYPDYIAADSQMWFDTGIAAGTTIADEFLAGMLEVAGSLDRMPQLIQMKKGPGARVAGKNVIHRLLRWQELRGEDGRLLPWAAPRLRVQEQCLYLRKTMRAIQTDPKKPEDVDTKSDDHGYDALRYLIASVPDAPEAPDVPVATDRHPGYDVENRRRARKLHPYEKQLRKLSDGGDDEGYTPVTPGYWRPGEERE